MSWGSGFGENQPTGAEKANVLAEAAQKGRE